MKYYTALKLLTAIDSSFLLCQGANFVLMLLHSVFVQANVALNALPE